MFFFSFKPHFFTHREYFKGSLLRSLYCWAPILIKVSSLSDQSLSWYFVKLTLPRCCCRSSKDFFSFVAAITPLPWIENIELKKSHISSEPSQSPRGADFQVTPCLHSKIFQRSLQPRLSVTSQICFSMSQTPTEGSGISLDLVDMAHTQKEVAPPKIQCCKNKFV